MVMGVVEMLSGVVTFGIARVGLLVFNMFLVVTGVVGWSRGNIFFPVGIFWMLVSERDKGLVVVMTEFSSSPLCSY